MENLKCGFNILGKYVVCLLMCFFITVSFSAIFSIATIEMIGYEAAVFENEDSNEPIEQYTHYYSDGTDTKKAQYEKEGYIVATREISSEFNGTTPYIVSHVISQIIALIIFVIIVPRTLYDKGRTDSNAVSFGRMEEDKLSGLKAGLVPASVSLVGWIFLITAKFGFFKAGLQVYSFLNYHLYGYQKLIFGTDPVIAVTELSWMSVILAILPVILTLILCTTTYLLGYKGINLYEKTIYKKTN